MRPRRIFLVGPPAAGKSTFARRWANTLKVPQVDTDSEIERRSGQSIAALFAEGEKTFREWERAVIQALLQEGQMGIWALGGGSLTQAELREILPKEGYILWIDPPWEWLVSRLQQSRTVRPLLHERPIPQWKDFLQNRRPFYRIADLHWDPARVPEPLVRAWVAGRLSVLGGRSSANSAGWSSVGDSTAAPNSALLPATKSHTAAQLPPSIVERNASYAKPDSVA